jgi:dsDNA-specific endonuclease/ATPase MutS2
MGEVYKDRDTRLDRTVAPSGGRSRYRSARGSSSRRGFPGFGVPGWFRAPGPGDSVSEMQFDVGDQVHVAVFGKGIVREVRNSGRYLVEVKGRAMLVAAAQLTAVETRKRRQKENTDTASSGVPAVLARTHAPRAIDLHGLTSEEAIAALDSFLNDAILAGVDEARVIHGRSGGRLKNAVHARLKNLPAIRGYRLDPANPGVTIVAL